MLCFCSQGFVFVVFDLSLHVQGLSQVHDFDQIADQFGVHAWSATMLLLGLIPRLQARGVFSGISLVSGVCWCWKSDLTSSIQVPKLDSLEKAPG